MAARLRAFRDDPDGNTLPTPSGKIEIFSQDDRRLRRCRLPGHPAWLAPTDMPDAARRRCMLVANQPATRLHSQLDFGGHSQPRNIAAARSRACNPADAAARGIADGDIIRLFNERGACLAAVRVTDGIAPGVVQLSDRRLVRPGGPGEDEAPLCVHGNPNVLTRDVGTSPLAQGCTGQLTTVEVESFTGNLPPIRAFDPPDQD